MVLIKDIKNIVFSYNGKLEDNTMFLCDFYDNIYDNVMQHEGNTFSAKELNAIYHKSLPCPFEYMDKQDTVVKKWWNRIKDSNFLKLAKEELYEDIFENVEKKSSDIGSNYFMECFEQIYKIKLARHPIIYDFNIDI